jgi:hypothetical protein
MEFLNLSLFSVVSIYLFLISCTVPIQQNVNQVRGKPIGIKKIAFIPFSSEQRYSVEESASNTIASEKEQFLTNALYSQLVPKVKGVNIVPIENSTALFANVEKENPQLAYKDVALRVGKGVGADAVLIGNVIAYTEREGTQFAIVSPASVAFDVKLLGTASGETIWENYFTETQKPLFENVTEVGKFFKRKGTWVTADEIATEGVKEVADKLSKFLEQE